jgi:hypothetical protein
MPDKQPIISKGTLVPLGLAASVVTAILVGAFWVSSSQHKVEIQLLDMNYRIGGLEIHMGEVKTSMSDRWRKADDDRRMKSFAQKLKISNPELNIPDPVN